jgi:hypothetical protein
MGFPAMLAWHDMIRFVLMECNRLRQQTILTPMGGMFRNQLAQTG